MRSIVAFSQRCFCFHRPPTGNNNANRAFLMTPVGRCCYDAVFEPQCADEVTAAECDALPGPRFFVRGAACGDLTVPCATDCNGNGLPDSQDIAAATSTDCNGNAVPDSCEVFGDANLDMTVNILDIFCVLDGFIDRFEQCALENVDLEPCAGDEPDTAATAGLRLAKVWVRLPRTTSSQAPLMAPHSL